MKGIARQAQPRISTKVLARAVVAKSHVRFIMCTYICTYIFREKGVRNITLCFSSLLMGSAQYHSPPHLTWDFPSHFFHDSLGQSFQAHGSGFCTSYVCTIHTKPYYCQKLLDAGSCVHAQGSKVTAGGGNADAIASHHSQTRR